MSAAQRLVTVGGPPSMWPYTRYFPLSGGAFLGATVILSATQGFAVQLYDPSAPVLGVDSGWLTPIGGFGVPPFSAYSKGDDPTATRRVQISDGTTLYETFTGPSWGQPTPWTNPPYSGFRSGNPVVISCDPLPPGAFIEAGGWFSILQP